MKMYQTYVCEKCGFESSNQEEVELCEAKHIGLNTLEDKHSYDALKSYAQYCGHVVSATNNDTTREAYDLAIENLIKFKKDHNMEIA